MILASLIGCSYYTSVLVLMVAHDDGFPLYKRIPERALHGIVTFFAGLLVFCGFDAHG
jgi:hypothetical protein